MEMCGRTCFATGSREGCLVRCICAHRVFLLQDAEKVRHRRSRVTQRLTVPQEYDSPLRLLRPCWTAFLRILSRVVTRDGM